MLVVSGAALAQELDDTQLSDEEAQYVAAVNEFMESLDPRSGRIEIGTDLATLDLPDEFYFLGRRDAVRVLVDAWGNPPGNAEGLRLGPSRRTTTPARTNSTGRRK